MADFCFSFSQQARTVWEKAENPIIAILFFKLVSLLNIILKVIFIQYEIH